MASARLSIVDLFNLESPIATEFRRLLHGLQHRVEKPDLKVIMITSAMLSEGKSTVASLLALTAARKGLKTLLIDCDLRRPSLHKLLALPRDGGVVEILSDGVMPRPLIKKTALEKLDFLSAGRFVSQPAEFFDPVALGKLFAEMKFYYDFVIVDTAPVIPVSDPMLLAPETDGVLLVVRAGSTQRNVVTRARDILASTSNKLLGVVLNNAANSLPYYYDDHYYGYHYPVKGSESNSGENAAKTVSRKPDKKTEPRPGNVVS